MILERLAALWLVGGSGLSKAWKGGERIGA